MKRLLIAAMALASLTATAQKKDKPATDTLEWAITPDGKDTIAFKMKGKDPVIKDPVKLTNFYWETREERDFLFRKIQATQALLSLVNGLGVITDPSKYFLIIAELHKN